MPNSFTPNERFSKKEKIFTLMMITEHELPGYYDFFNQLGLNNISSVRKLTRFRFWESRIKAKLDWDKSMGKTRYAQHVEIETIILINLYID